VTPIGRNDKEPDGTFTPEGRPSKDEGTSLERRYPALVVEVAHKNESYDRLIEILDLWLSDDTDVSVAIGLKIGSRRKDGTYRFRVRDIIASIHLSSHI